MIDFTKPLETVHGRKVTVKHLRTYDANGGAEVFIEGESHSRTYYGNGRHYAGGSPDLRNVALPEPFEFIDVSVEVSRTYTFPTGTVTIDKPEKLHVSPSHSHRLIDADGRSHYVPTGWLHLSWTVKPGAPHFVA